MVQKEEVAEVEQLTKERPVTFTVRFTPRQHDALRRIAFDRRISMQALVMEGVADVLHRHGR